MRSAPTGDRDSSGSSQTGRRPSHLDRTDESERLRALLMFQLWYLLYVEEALTEAPPFTWDEVAA